MRQEIVTHKDKSAQTSYLGHAVLKIATLGRNNDSLAAVEKLSQDIQGAIQRGDKGAAARFAIASLAVIDEDRKALHRDSLITQYGTGMAKTAGLFIAGKPGYAIASAIYALDQAKPGDSADNQLMDFGTGLTKGLVLKKGFQYVGGRDLGIAAKGISLGIFSRATDIALTRATYADGDGYSALSGLNKTLKGTISPALLTSDVVTFGLAHGALNKINGATGGALHNSPFWSTVATGGVFGVSNGSVSEISRQTQAGESFNFQKVLTAAALTGAGDMIAAIPGGKMASVHAARERLRASEQIQPDKGKPNIALAVQRNFPGSTSREFQLVKGDQKVVELLADSPGKFVLAPVREVSSSGQLGPQKNMLIQHMEASKDGASMVATNRSAYMLADLLASCNPKALPSELKAKHIIPSAESLWLTQEKGGRLRFSTVIPTELKPNESQPVKLGSKTVSELLLGPETPKHFENTHDKVAMAKAMKHFRTPVRYFNGGADSIAFELPDKNILKITDKGWDPTWGERKIWTSEGMRVIDAPILQKPQTIYLPETPVTFFIQKRMLSPVTERDVRMFDSLIARDATYKFWDNDFTSHGRSQIGLDPRTRLLYLIDYDAVRLPNLVPKQSEPGGSTWFAARYEMHH